tara:strand:+ start:2330 stop:2542 length:213 start_codon:yes stop_codon:yes gene_type:complete
MNIPLDELKARVGLYFTPEELVEVLAIEHEILIDILEDIIWDQQEDLIAEMGVIEETDDTDGDGGMDDGE